MCIPPLPPVRDNWAPRPLHGQRVRRLLQGADRCPERPESPQFARVWVSGVSDRSQAHSPSARCHPIRNGTKAAAYSPTLCHSSTGAHGIGAQGFPQPAYWTDWRARQARAPQSPALQASVLNATNSRTLAKQPQTGRQPPPRPGPLFGRARAGRTLVGTAAAGTPSGAAFSGTMQSIVNDSSSRL